MESMSEGSIESVPSVEVHMAGNPASAHNNPEASKMIYPCFHQEVNGNKGNEATESKVQEVCPFRLSE